MAKHEITPLEGEQGELFIATISDQANPNSPKNTPADLTPAPEGGVYPSDLELSDGQQTLANFDLVVQKRAAWIQAISDGNKGKHTPGEGRPVMPGDVVDGRIVTERNLSAARTYVAEQRRRAAKNMLDFASPVTKVIEEAANEHSVDTVLSAPYSKPKVEQARSPFYLEDLSERIKTITERAYGANFVPSLKDEITTKLPLLEYKHRGHVHNHLEETARHNQKSVLAKGYPRIVADWQGQRAVYSRIYEMSDYLADARYSYHQLDSLKAEMDTGLAYVTPKLSLAEAFGADNPALRVLARDVLVLQLGDKKVDEKDLPFKPMTSQEVRHYTQPDLVQKKDESLVDYRQRQASITEHVRAHQGDYDDQHLRARHKYVVSPFVGNQGEVAPKIEDYVTNFAGTTTLGHLRRSGLLEKLISMQQNRYWHWRADLADVSGPYKQVTEQLLAEYPTAA